MNKWQLAAAEIAGADNQLINRLISVCETRTERDEARQEMLDYFAEAWADAANGNRRGMQERAQAQLEVFDANKLIPDTLTAKLAQARILNRHIVDEEREGEA